MSDESRSSRPLLPVVCLLLPVVLSLFLAACGSETVPTTGSTPAPGHVQIVPPEDLLMAGTLTVGSDTTYPPQELIDPKTQQPTGFDIDLISAMATLMGLKVTIVPTSFTTIIDSLENRRFDVVISAITMQSERKKKADFVHYFNAGSSLLVPQGNPLHLKGESDLCGLKVGVQKATIQYDALTAASQTCTKQGKQAISMITLEKQSDVVALLTEKRAAATYQDSPVTDYYIQQNPGQFTIGGSIIDAAPEGIAVRKGDTQMLIAMQTAFDVLQINGIYHKLIVKWGVTSGELQDS